MKLSQVELTDKHLGKWVTFTHPLLKTELWQITKITFSILSNTPCVQLNWVENWEEASSYRFATGDEISAWLENHNELTGIKPYDPNDDIEKYCKSPGNIFNDETQTKLESLETKPDEYDMINPPHYKDQPIETIEKMRRIWGDEMVSIYCDMTAFKYRERIGNKPGQTLDQESQKIKWNESKSKELRRI